MARPKKAAEAKRDFMLYVRFTQTEKQMLLDNAAEIGCTVSDFVRLKSLGNATLVVKASGERASLIVGLGQLGKLSSNVNQIARALNRRALTERGEWVPDELIQHTLHGVDTLSHHLIKLLDHGH